MKQLNIKGFTDEEMEKLDTTARILNFRSIAEFVRKTLLDLCDKTLKENT